MSFKIIPPTKGNFNNQELKPSSALLKKEKIYSQEDIDLIDEKFREKEERLKKLIQPAKPLFDEYKKSLINTKKYEKDIISYDSNTGKWVLKKESEK